MWVLILGACGSTSQPGDPVVVADTAPAAPAAVDDPCARTGSWRALAGIELPGRVDHTAVWTGSEMVLWGGTQGMRSPRTDGARYQPATDRWVAMSEDQVPVGRDDHAAVWTGSEMIVWGGNHDSEHDDKLDSGGRYDPVADRWRLLPRAGLTARDDPRAVWTGSEMIVWGGRDEAGHTRDGARYSPATNGWRPVSLRGAPEAREDHTAVWTGSEMIVWGGWNGDDDARNYALAGSRYDPRTDRWRPISRDGAPEPREDHSAVWTGSEMIVWGGVRRDATSGERHQLATGGRYDPATDTWRPLAQGGAPEAREDGVVVWTGSEMLVWGGQQADVPLASGARYLAAADTWCPIASDGAPVARRDHAGVWDGRELVVWGGRNPEGDYVASGAAFAP